MLLDKRIPKTFWSEVINWIVHVLNRCPTLVVKNVTPIKAWNGDNVFGYVSLIHVPYAKITKLENNSIIGVLLGFQ